MQETTMARCIADVLGLSTRQNGRGRVLADWNASDAVGCLGTEVEEIMQSLGQVGVLMLYSRAYSLTSAFSRLLVTVPCLYWRSTVS